MFPSESASSRKEADLQRIALLFPSEMADYFSSRWNPRLLWQLELPVETIPVETLEWHLDYPFWPSNPPWNIFDLKPRDVLSDCELHRGHYSRILNADTACPLEVGVFGETVVILDGIHRLAKLVLQSVAEVEVRYVPDDHITRTE